MGTARSKSLARLQKIGKFLDSSIPIGKTDYSIGFDPIIGLIPGIGDAIGVLIGSYIIVEAAWLGASRATLARMMINLIVDGLLGAVPFLGDLFDFAFKANQRNINILKETKLISDHKSGQRLTSAFLLTLSLVLLFVVLVLALVVYGTVKLFKWGYTDLSVIL